MNVLCDYHHGPLYYSMVRLFEDRMGWKVWRPTGSDWYTKGFWRYSDNPSTIKQYLEPSSDVAGMKVGAAKPADVRPDGVYEWPWHEGENHYTMRAVTLEAFKRMDWQFVIASVCNHEEPFARLIREHAPGAVLIRQMGNIHDHFDEVNTKNVLNSTMHEVPAGINTVRYHQEFDLKVYRPDPPPDTRTVKSFLHAFATTEPPQLVSDHQLYHAMQKAMPDFTFKCHGVLCEDGNLPSADMPQAIRSSAFVCHLKFWGDGFGHTLHNAGACGKPVITKLRYFEGMMAGELLEAGKTAIDLCDDVASNVEMIRYWSEPSRYAELSRNMRERFLKVVDFDAEFERIKAFLDRSLNIVQIQ